MKRAIVVFLIMYFMLSGCSSHESQPVVDIVMPNDTYYYETEDWSVDSLVQEFETLGFTNIITENMGTSSDYVYGPIHTVRIDREMTGWSKGDSYKSNDKVEISYYDPTPTLTAENCPNLASILNGDTSSWLDFAKEYDDEYIEFDGCVVDRIDDVILSDPLIYVCGGDYSDASNKQQIRLTYLTLDYEVSRHAFYGSVGKNYKIIGKVDLRDSEYYKMLTINTVLIEDR